MTGRPGSTRRGGCGRARPARAALPRCGGPRLLPRVVAAGRYAVNILGEGQQPLADCFAGVAVAPGLDAFCGAAWYPGESGLPLIDGSIATLECTIAQCIPVGDHDLFIGRVDT